jgi:hypothetical protein
LVGELRRRVTPKDPHRGGHQQPHAVQDAIPAARCRPPKRFVASPPGPRSAAGDNNTDARTADIGPRASDQAGAAPQAPRGPRDGHGATPDIRAALADPAIRDFVGLAENAYDFNRPDSIPGFGPMRPFDDIDELVAQATGRPADRTSEARVESSAATKRAQ